MRDFIKRDLSFMLNQYLDIFPVVALLGPRQCGKSTLVKSLDGDLDNVLYLDLQRDADRNKLSQPTLFFEANKDKIICLDEIQLVPELFSILRSVVDHDRRNGRFILLGSASRELIQHTSESLAGRIGLLNLAPFTIKEVRHLLNYTLQKFWLRGGFPESFLTDNDQYSMIWRENYIRTYVERDIPQLGFQIPALQLKRFLTMCAHNQGQLLNASKLGESLGLTHPTVRRYIDLLEQTFILRTLQPYEPNVKKRLVKAPKVFVRDSGLLHQLLDIADYNSLLGNPVFGSSWEGMVIENILAVKSDWNSYFYRTATGDELDLVLEKGNQRIVVECKASPAPKVTKGFWRSLEVVKPNKTYIIAPVDQGYPLSVDVWICGLEEFLFKEK